MHYVVSPSSDTKNPVFKFWTAVTRGLLAQNEMNETLSPDLVSVLALGDVDPLGRSGLSADAAIRSMHTNLVHASVPDMQRMLLAARAPQPILDALKRFSCAQCDAIIKAAPEQLRHRTAEEQETDRAVLRDLRRTADILRESGSAKNFEDITEQDWPDGDLNSTAGDIDPNQETSKS